MNSKQLRVDINGEQVGIATQDIDGDITFRYEEGAPRALSLSLPLSPEAKRFKRKACRGYFDGLLPEGDHVREAIARRYGISANNNFSILRAIGEDCAGAVSFHAVGDQAAAEHSDSSELSGSALSDEALEKLLIELPRKPLATGLDGNVRLSLAGAQDKTALLFVDGQAYIPSDGVPSTHILKPSIANFEETVANEYICLSAAAQMGVKVPQVEMRQVGDTPYFLIERYDRQRAGKRVKRVHQEDFCQALNVQCVKKYEKDGGPSFKDCFELLQHCNSPIVARQEMLKRLVFNYLIGNNDAHGKNFSFLYERAGSVVLSPAYDILCTQVYPGISTEMAMLIGKQYRHQEVSLKDWQLLAKDCGLDFSILRSLAMTQAERLPDLLRDLATSYDNK
ncbi:MAG: type II toxin-antitoxin system HipA family toxin, partial [Akkermansia sp.]